MASNNTVNRYVNVYISSGEAQKALDALLAKEKKLNEEIAKSPKNVDALKSKLEALQEPLERARKKVSGELEPSFKDTQKTVTILSNQLKRMSESDADFSKVVNQYREANKELDQQKGKIGFLRGAMKSFWQEAKTVAVGVVVGNTVQSMLQSVVGYVTGIFTGAAKISDELSDIEKTTGLTKEQVKQVNSELKKIDTRTSSSELRKLAQEAGKLGKESVEDVVRFVKEADQIRVALGEDLGEDAIISIGKLSKIFKVSMLEIGSAINEIGANSEASERFSVDFLNRLAGTGPAVKLAAGDLLGYGAALENAGQTAEVSGTALSTFFIEFTRDTEKFGKVAGFAKGELEELINTKGTNEGVLTFLTRLKEANPDAQQFLQKMQQLGVDGSRGANVLLALSGNIEEVRKQQTIANTALAEGTSLTEEFNKKNNNAGAELDKLKKNFAGLFTSRTFQEAGEGAIRLLNNFVNVIKGIPEFIEENRFALLTLAAGIALLNKQYILSALATARETAAKIANTIVTKGTAFANNIAIASQAAYIVVTNLLTGRIKLATAAQRLWNVAMSLGAGPIGILLIAVGALVLGLNSLLGSTGKLTAAQKLNLEIENKAAEIYSSQVASIKQKLALAANENLSLAQRKKALDDVKKSSDGYLKNLTLENLKTEEGTALIDKYIESLKKSARAKAVAALAEEKEKRKIEIQAQLDVLNKSFDVKNETGAKAFTKNLVAGIFGGSGTTGQQIRELKNEFSTLNTEVSSLYQLIGNSPDLQEQIVGPVAGSIQQIGDSIASLKEKLKGLQEERENTTDDKRRADLNKEIAELEAKIAKMEGRAAASAKKAENDLEKLREELRKMGQEFSVMNLSAMDAALRELGFKYAKLIERAKGNNKLLLEIDRLFNIERLKIIEDFARKEVELIQNSKEKIIKETDEQFKARIKGLSTFAKDIEDKLIGQTAGIDRGRLAERELAVLKANGKKKLDAELELLREQERQELMATDKTEKEKELIRFKYSQKRKEAEVNYWMGVIDTITEFAQMAVNILSTVDQAKTDKENAELERDKNLNEKKRKNLEDRLKSQQITQLEYDRSINKMQADQDRKEKAIKERQFRRQQTIAVLQAMINTAQGVTKAIAEYSWPYNLIVAAITAGLGAVQIASIRSRKPTYAKGGKISGPSHQDKSNGMPVVNPYTGDIHAYLEGGEAITNKKTMSDRRRYTVEGTPSQIISKLNGMNGVSWDSGARLIPAWKNAQPQPWNYPAVKKYYAVGGVFDSKLPSTPPQQVATATQQQAVSSEQVEVIKELTAAVSTLNSLLARGIKANVILTELEEQEDRLAAIRDDATMKG